MACGTRPSADDMFSPPPTPPVSPADTATNCYLEKQDKHGYINRKWFWIGIEEGRYSEVKCFHIDTSGYSDPKATTGNWIIYNEGSMDVGGPGKWSRCSYIVDAEKKSFKMYDFKSSRNDPDALDTISFEITRLDDEYLIVVNRDSMLPEMSHLYRRRR